MCFHKLSAYVIFIQEAKQGSRLQPNYVQCTIVVLHAKHSQNGELPVKFIHIADVHLGVTPDAGKPWSQGRAHEIWESFAGVIAAAKQEAADFLFITGDLFHAQPLKKELREVDALFREIPDTKVLLIAGNHDFLRPKSYYLSYPWAENVYIFKREEPDCFDFPEENVTVYGLSYWHRELRGRLYDGLQPKAHSRINILMAHGGDEGHIPFSAQRIIQNGFDYLAAGHIHRGGWLIEGRALMAGSLEPTDCNDTGPHGYWMGTLTKAGAQVHFYPIHHCEYCHEIYEVHPRTTGRELLQWAHGLLDERPKYQYFRLFLRGRRDPDITYELSEIEELERIVDVTEQLVPDYNYEKLSEEYAGSLLEAYIGRMGRRTQDVRTKRALEYGVNALLGHRL